MAAAALGILLATATSVAQVVDARPNDRSGPRDTLERLSYSDGTDILSIGIEAAAPLTGGSFFDEYRKLGGRADDIGVYAAPRITGRRTIGGALRAVIDVGMHRGTLEELYEIRRRVQPDSTAYVASVGEHLAITAVPLLGGLEYSPLRAQFTSYVGLLAGPAVTYASWTSSVVHGSGYERPRANVQNYGLAPAVRVYAGVDLRFDRLVRVPSAFRGIFLEAAYVWLPVTRDYFRVLREAGTPGPSSDSGTLFLGGLSFTFGLNLQVLRR